MKDKLELYQKLHKVRESIHSISYDSINNFEKFSYVSSPIVLKHIRELLNKNRLVMETDMHNYKSTLRDDGKTIFTECEFIYRFVCIDTGAYTECKFAGQGIGKSSEKGVGKCATYSEKYFLLKYFNLPTHKNDDPDFKRDIDAKPATTTAVKKPTPSSTKPEITADSNPAIPKNTLVPSEKKENVYMTTVFSFFDEKQRLDVARFANESAQRQEIDVERLYESASKRKEDFIKAFEVWISKTK